MSFRKAVRTTTLSIEEENREIILEYYILESDISLEGELHRTYGIEVLKREKTTQGTLRVEYRKIFDIFCTYQEAEKALHILADNTVMPVSVYDIIEQFIGTGVIECEEYEIKEAV